MVCLFFVIPSSKIFEMTMLSSLTGKTCDPYPTLKSMTWAVRSSVRSQKEVDDSTSGAAK